MSFCRHTNLMEWNIFNLRCEFSDYFSSQWLEICSLLPRSIPIVSMFSFTHVQAQSTLLGWFLIIRWGFDSASGNTYQEEPSSSSFSFAILFKVRRTRAFAQSPPILDSPIEHTLFRYDKSDFSQAQFKCCMWWCYQNEFIIKNGREFFELLLFSSLQSHITEHYQFQQRQTNFVLKFAEVEQSDKCTLLLTTYLQTCRH